MYFRFNYKLLTILLLSTMVINDANSDPGDEMLRELFQYEINNRAFARKTIPHIADTMKGSEEEAFWMAFSRLEKLSEPLYREMARKHDLEINTLLVNLKTWSLNLAMRVAPNKTMKMMSDATEKYVEKLKLLPGLATPEDRAFFEYVLAQEQAQLQGVQLRNQGKYDEAAKVIDSFVDSFNGLP